jgi:4-hydroxy-tetrahydrodipicolinate synthase
MTSLNRRTFVSILGAGVLDAAFGTRARPQSPQTGGKPLRGIFAIAQTPFTDSNQLDLDVLTREVDFVDRGGVHGFVWPQLASEYSTLSKSERLAGAEAVLAKGKRLRPAIVIGVQGPDARTAIEYARHAEQHGADAIISLPPAPPDSDEEMLAYYTAVGKATELPLIVQTTRNMSVALLVRMFKEIPTVRCVKDEAGGSPLGRIGQLREQTSDQLKVFTGNHSRTLIDEMQRGSSGSMPSAAFADLYASAWDLWHAGWQKEAVDLFEKAVLFIPEMEAYGIAGSKYLFCLRGVFKNYAVRVKDSAAPLDASAKKSLRDLATFVNPYFKCCAVASELSEGAFHD